MASKKNRYIMYSEDTQKFMQPVEKFFSEKLKDCSGAGIDIVCVYG